MKVLVLGHAGHGKGTFCGALNQVYGLRSLSSSVAALPHILPALRAATGMPYRTHADAYLDRARYRELWKRLISLYNSPDKSTLSREILLRVDVYDGMRCAEEYQASRHLFDLVLWVDASERVGPDSTMSIEYDAASMVRVYNNGSLADLSAAAEDLRPLLNAPRFGGQF